MKEKRFGIIARPWRKRGADCVLQRNPHRVGNVGGRRKYNTLHRNGRSRYLGLGAGGQRHQRDDTDELIGFHDGYVSPLYTRNPTAGIPVNNKKAARLRTASLEYRRYGYNIARHP
jgi:hypothetical protein